MIIEKANKYIEGKSGVIMYMSHDEARFLKDIMGCLSGGPDKVNNMMHHMYHKLHKFYPGYTPHGIVGKASGAVNVHHAYESAHGDFEANLGN